ncbi:MAG: hypothetical protein WA865_01685 [Spirulinaceae cyanobacterium]
MLAKLKSSDFRPYLQQKFYVFLDENDFLEVELIEVSDYPEQNLDTGRPFDLVFRLPKGFVLPQETYTFKQDQLGKLELFVVPIGSDGKGQLYQAVFN